MLIQETHLPVVMTAFICCCSVYVLDALLYTVILRVKLCLLFNISPAGITISSRDDLGAADLTVKRHSGVLGQHEAILLYPFHYLSDITIAGFGNGDGGASGMMPEILSYLMIFVPGYSCAFFTDTIGKAFGFELFSAFSACINTHEIILTKNNKKTSEHRL